MKEHLMPVLQEARMFILAKFFMLNNRKWTATATIMISVSVFLVSLIGMGCDVGVSGYILPLYI
jgi:hypothetical protein